MGVKTNQLGKNMSKNETDHFCCHYSLVEGLKLMAKRDFFILEADRELIESVLVSDLDGTSAFSLSLFTEFGSGTLNFSDDALVWFPSAIFLSL